MTDKHLSSQFDAELSGISTRVLEMGGLVESQVAQAVYALTHFSGETATQVLKTRKSASTRWRSRSTRPVDHHRPSPAHGPRPAPADRDLQDHRQPGAGGRRGGAHRAHRAAPDQHRRVQPLRLPVATCQPLRPTWPPPQLRKALDAFARLDTGTALEVLKQDDQIDQEFDGLMRKLITYMMEDPRTISASHRPGLRGQGHRAGGRPRQEPGRGHHLHRQGHRRAAHLAGSGRETHR
jgi:phosphate transport system protein